MRGILHAVLMIKGKKIKIPNSSLTSIVMLFAFPSISDVGVIREIKIDTMYLKNSEDPAYVSPHIYEFVTETRRDHANHFIWWSSIS